MATSSVPAQPPLQPSPSRRVARDALSPFLFCPPNFVAQPPTSRIHPCKTTATPLRQLRPHPAEFSPRGPPPKKKNYCTRFLLLACCLLPGDRDLYCSLATHPPPPPLFFPPFLLSPSTPAFEKERGFLSPFRSCGCSAFFGTQPRGCEKAAEEAQPMPDFITKTVRDVQGPISTARPLKRKRQTVQTAVPPPAAVARSPTPKRPKTDSTHVVDFAKASPPQHLPVPVSAPAPVTADTERLKDVIEFQFALEILLKHNELRLIDQELAKCQVAPRATAPLPPHPLSHAMSYSATDAGHQQRQRRRRAPEARRARAEVGPALRRRRRSLRPPLCQWLIPRRRLRRRRPARLARLRPAAG